MNSWNVTKTLRQFWGGLIRAAMGAFAFAFRYALPQLVSLRNYRFQIYKIHLSDLKSKINYQNIYNLNYFYWKIKYYELRRRGDAAIFGSGKMVELTIRFVSGEDDFPRAFWRVTRDMIFSAFRAASFTFRQRYYSLGARRRMTRCCASDGCAFVSARKPDDLLLHKIQAIGWSQYLEPTKFVILRIFGPNVGQIWQFWCFWKAEIEIYPNLAN